MDSDCLIKLAKAGLKERVCTAWEVSIPSAVRRETVEQAPGLPDARRIGENIAAGRLTVVGEDADPEKGEEAALMLYRSGGFDAVATDDARFIRYLRGLSVPFAVPSVLLVMLRQAGALSATEAAGALSALRPHISGEEHAAAYLMLGQGDRP